MANARSSIDVHRPIREVYHQWTEPERFPHFMAAVKSVDKIGHGRTHWVVSIGGVRREFDAEVTSQAEDDHVAWQAIGDLVQGGRVEFTAVDPGTTTVTLTLDWDPAGFTEKAGAALNVDHAIVHADLDRFKKFIESTP